MIFRYKITVTELAKAGKNFNWLPHQCEKCQRKMWGHGYVARYFSGHCNQIYLKRYRCPDCHSVVTARPEAYWTRLRSSVQAIYDAIRERLQIGKWPDTCPRQRGGHWLKRFMSFVRMEGYSQPLSCLDFCFEKQIPFLV
jgi:hypothetical protein